MSLADEMGLPDRGVTNQFIDIPAPVLAPFLSL